MSQSVSLSTVNGAASFPSACFKWQSTNGVKCLFQVTVYPRSETPVSSYMLLTEWDVCFKWQSTHGVRFLFQMTVYSRISSACSHASLHRNISRSKTSWTLCSAWPSIIVPVCYVSGELLDIFLSNWNVSFAFVGDWYIFMYDSVFFSFFHDELPAYFYKMRETNSWQTKAGRQWHLQNTRTCSLHQLSVVIHRPIHVYVKYLQKFSCLYMRGYIQKFPDWVDNEINNNKNNNNKHRWEATQMFMRHNSLDWLTK